MPWKPSEPGELPTLGYLAIDWMTEYLAEPDRDDYAPFTPYLEQEDFLLRWYQLDPTTGRFAFQRGLLGRPRGWGKSPLLAAVSCLEALAPICFAGWDAQGQPVGRPWRDIRTPNVHIAAVSEEQADNTWQPVLQMLDGPIQYEHPELEPMETQVLLPGRGKMMKRTASARTIKGARPVFAVLDQTEEWVPSNGGVRLAGVMRANAAKVGGRTLESPNAYIPGEESVAESSAAYAEAISEGRARAEGLLYDHREAPADTDLTDRDSLVAGLRVAYGDSSKHPGGCVIHDPPCKPGHTDLEPLVLTFWDPAQDVQQSRSDFLNQITHASDAWVERPVWRSRIVDDMVKMNDMIVLGFDGSKGRNRGKADATAIVGVRIHDGFCFKVRIWEQPPGLAGKDWVPPVTEVNAEMDALFDRYKVMGLYADPSGWATQVAAWEARYGRRLRVKAHAHSPIAVWPRGKDSRVVEYVERLRLAIINGEMSHDGDGDLERHVMNARSRDTRTGKLLYKAYPDSPNKIDAAYALTMAWKARTDALAQGIGKKRTSRGRVTILR